MNWIPNCRTCDQHWYEGVDDDPCHNERCEFKKRARLLAACKAITAELEPLPPGPELTQAVDVPRLLALLKRARHFSDGMNLAAYEAIQEAICELEPNQPNDHPR